MNRPVNNVAFSGAVLALSAVILASLGAHLIPMNGLADVWRTASIIHMFNAAGLLGIAALLASRESTVLKWGAWLIAMGTLLFSGTIYAHVISGYQVPGLTPVGGLIMMVGWAFASMAFLSKS